jgi:CubicO group peptidase (beta-lactamase class C family)
MIPDVSGLVDEVLGQHTGMAPGVSIGVVRDGALVHAVGRGMRIVDGPEPDADTVFRIASMTKSFTAATVLLLRDEGRLRLDDALADHLPAARSLTVPGPLPLTLRDLLTMGAGLPTDDPWGDRQESLPAAEFDALVAAGLTFNRPPRTAFEYSNTSYALLGRVIEQVCGEPYATVVRRRLLAPLGMTATAVDVRDTPADLRAVGYRLPPDRAPEPQPEVLPGAFSPMGGLHSTVRDLAVWVDGFLQAWGDGRPGHPVSPASLREQQEWARLVSVDADPSGARLGIGYGFGLLVFEHEHLGRMVGHSGGYPGFGSHMRWHPASGWGVVALANATYAPAVLLAQDLLARLVTEHGREPVVAPHARTLTAMDIAEALLHGDDSAVTDDLWSPNMDLDLPRHERLAAIAAEVAAAGGGAEWSRVTESVRLLTPTRVQWRMASPTGRHLVLEVLLTPERPPRIQRIAVTPSEGIR